MAELLSGDLIRAVGDHLVGVHIGLGAGSGLPDHEREMPVQLAGDHLVGGLRNGPELFVRHFLWAEGVIGGGGGFFQDAEGPDDLRGHGLDPDADREILVAAFGLRAPQAVGGDLHLAHRVVFDAVFHI